MAIGYESDYNSLSGTVFSQYESEEAI